jgi:hypothetical protein
MKDITALFNFLSVQYFNVKSSALLTSKESYVD